MTGYIQGRNVSLTFRPPNRMPVRALGNFDIDVEEGEFLSIVGPSGCGKSTFLNVLLGLTKPDSGDVLMHGKRITGPGSDRAMVFQEFGLLPWRTVLANVELGLELKGVPAGERRAQCQKFVEMVGLTGFEHHYPHELSDRWQISIRRNTTSKWGKTPPAVSRRPSCWPTPSTGPNPPTLKP